MAFAVVATVEANLIGSKMAADASRDAANTQAASADRANQLQKEMYDQTRKDNEGVRARGDSAGNRLAYLMGLQPTSSQPPEVLQARQAPSTFQSGQTDDPLWEKILGDFNASHQARFGIPMNRSWNADADARGAYQNLVNQYNSESAAQKAAEPPPPDPTLDPAYGSLARAFSKSDFEKDPGYQFRMDEGMKGIDNSAAARGMSLSGGALKAIQKYGQEFASNEYGNAYNRFNNDQTTQYNRLAGVAGTGQQATNNVNAAGSNYASNAGKNITGAGNAMAAGQVGAANAWSNGISQSINGYQQNQLMNLLQRTPQSRMPSYNYLPDNNNTTIPMQQGGGY